jgi:hypothetical protein
VLVARRIAACVPSSQTNQKQSLKPQTRRTEIREIRNIVT